MQKLIPLVSYDINIPLVLFLLNFTSFLLKNSQLDCHLQFVDIVVFSHIKQEIIQKVNDLWIFHDFSPELDKWEVDEILELFDGLSSV